MSQTAKDKTTQGQISSLNGQAWIWNMTWGEKRFYALNSGKICSCSSTLAAVLASYSAYISFTNEPEM